MSLLGRIFSLEWTGARAVWGTGDVTLKSEGVGFAATLCLLQISEPSKMSTRPHPSARTLAGPLSTTPLQWGRPLCSDGRSPSQTCPHQLAPDHSSPYAHLSPCFFPTCEPRFYCRASACAAFWNILHPETLVHGGSLCRSQFPRGLSSAAAPTPITFCPRHSPHSWPTASYCGLLGPHLSAVNCREHNRPEATAVL